MAVFCFFSKTYIKSQLSFLSLDFLIFFVIRRKSLYVLIVCERELSAAIVGLHVVFLPPEQVYINIYFLEAFMRRLDQKVELNQIAM